MTKSALVPLCGVALTESSSATWNALSSARQKAVGLALLYGYQGNRDNLTGGDDEKWLATQTLVWEFVTGCRSVSAPYEQISSTIYSLHFGSNYPNEGVRAAYEQIVSMLNRHLMEIEQTAHSRMEQITAQMAREAGVTEELKASDQMKWMGLTNNIRPAAEETVLTELIYN